jgi:hypothetical protein
VLSSSRTYLVAVYEPTNRTGEVGVVVDPVVVVVVAVAPRQLLDRMRPPISRGESLTTFTPLATVL